MLAPVPTKYLICSTNIHTKRWCACVCVTVDIAANAPHAIQSSTASASTHTLRIDTLPYHKRSHSVRALPQLDVRGDARATPRRPTADHKRQRCASGHRRCQHRQQHTRLCQKR
jgi:hypothetical protein